MRQHIGHSTLNFVSVNLSKNQPRIFDFSADSSNVVTRNRCMSSIFKHKLTFGGKTVPSNFHLWVFLSCVIEMKAFEQFNRSLGCMVSSCFSHNK